MAALYYRDMSVGGTPGEEIVKRYFNDKLWEDIHAEKKEKELNR